MRLGSAQEKNPANFLHDIWLWTNAHITCCRSAKLTYVFGGATIHIGVGRTTPAKRYLINRAGDRWYVLRARAGILPVTSEISL